MKLTRPLCFIDIEATGLDVATDRIVQLGCVMLMPSGAVFSNQWLINPERPIPPEASKIHEITDFLVKEEPNFLYYADKVCEWVTGVDLAGYNLLNFDVPILWEEFARCGMHLDLTGVEIIDCGNIFKKKEPRTLEAAVRKYAKREHVGAHDALADAQATMDVYHGQLTEYPDLGAMALGDLAKFSRLEDLPRIDLAGKLVRDADGDAVFNFGKAKGVKVRDDMGFARWMLNKDFSRNVKFHVEHEIERIHQAVYAALREEVGA